MPQKRTKENEPAEPTAPLSIEERLDAIISLLEHINRRDRIRAIGSLLRTLLGLIPLILLLWSAWYFYTHGEDVLESITREAVRQSADYSQGSLMKQLEDMMQQR